MNLSFKIYRLLFSSSNSSGIRVASTALSFHHRTIAVEDYELVRVRVQFRLLLSRPAGPPARPQAGHPENKENEQ